MLAILIDSGFVIPMEIEGGEDSADASIIETQVDYTLRALIQLAWALSRVRTKAILAGIMRITN